MAEEQITKKSILDYIERIKRLDLNKKEIKEVQRRIIDKLNVLIYSMRIIMKRIEDNQKKIEEHWYEFGDNYNSIPTLHSTIPNYTESYGEFVALSYEERTILVDGLIELFELVDKQKIEIKPVEEKPIEPVEEKDELMEIKPIEENE